MNEKAKLFGEMDGVEFQVETLRLQPEDVIVLTFLNPITAEAAGQLHERMVEQFDGHKILVLYDAKVSIQREVSAA